MGPAAFVIAVMGCADGGAACTAIETLPTTYHSEAACSAASNDALRMGGSYDYPTIVVECRPAAAIRTAQPRSKRITDGGRSGS